MFPRVASLSTEHETGSCALGHCEVSQVGLGEQEGRVARIREHTSEHILAEEWAPVRVRPKAASGGIAAGDRV